MKHLVLLLQSKISGFWSLMLLFTLFSQNLFSQTDLALSQSVDVSNTSIGSNLIFTVTVNNEGNTAITGLQVGDNLPSGTTLVSAIASIGIYNPTTGIWDIADNMTAATASATLTLEVTVTHDGLIYNLAEIIAMNEADADSTPNNSDYTEDDIASACSTVPIKLCTASNESYTLTAAAAFSNYEWFRIYDNGGSLDTVSVGTSQSLVVNQLGDYYYTADITGSTCSGGSCCPIIVEEGCFDLSIDLTTTSTNVIVGDNVPFSLSVNNEGSIDANNVVVEINVPTGFTFIPADNPDWILMPSGKIQTTVQNLTIGGNSTVALQLTVNGSAGLSNDLDVVAEIISSEDLNGDNLADTDSTEGNASSTEDDDAKAVVVLSEFDLSLTLLTTSTIVSVGDDVTYTLNLANQGAVDAQNVGLVVYLPSGFDFVAADNPDWTDIGGGKLTTSIASLLTTATTTKNIVLKVNNTAGSTAGDIIVGAEIMSSDNANVTNVPDVDSVPDADKTNDLVIDRTGVSDHIDIDIEEGDEDDMDIAVVTLNLGDFDLALNMSTTSTNVIAGDDVPFVVNVVNEGDINAQNVVIETTIPTGFTFVPADNPNWTLMPSGKIQSTVSTLNTTETNSINLVLNVNVSAGQPNDLIVFSEIISSEDTNGISLEDIDSTEGNDSVLEDDDDSASVVLLEYDLSLTVIGDKTMAMVGDNVDFTIRVANQGVIMAQAIDIVGYIPTGYDFVLADNTGWTDIGGGKVTYQVASLGVGGDLAFHLILKVNATAGSNTGDLVFASEIMQSKNGNDLWVPDVDSTPDMDPTNDQVIDRLGATDHIDIDFVTDDEDDMDIAIVSLLVPAEFDLALTVLTSSAPVNIGDDVTFNVNLANQGGVDAQNIGVVAYIPSGFDFVAADNTGWTDIGGGKVTFTQNALISGNTAQVDLVLKVNNTAGTTANDLTVGAEIMSAEDTTGATPTDDDSTPDMDATNDLVVDRTGTNDHITIDNDANDEDDMDIAVATLQGEFDLALTMLTASTSVMVNDDITYTINVANQGAIDAQNITIVAYIPTGFDFDATNNPDWTDIGGGKVTYTIASTLAATATVSKNLVLTVNASAGTMPGDLVTAAEIMSAEDTNSVAMTDSDSTFDMDPTNDLTIDRTGANDHIDFDNEADDEDDMDIAVVTLLNCTDVSVGEDQVICQGSSVQLNAIGNGGTYTWTGSLGLSCTDCSDPIASPTTTTNYVVSNVDGACSSSDTITVTVVPSIQVVPNITARECCSAGAITLNVSGGSGTGFTYQWTDNVSTTNEATNLNAGTYDVTITDNGGTCSTVESYVVADNCSMTGCDPLFTETDTVVIQQGESYTTCMTMKLEDILQYDVNMDNEVYNDPITACNVDTLLYYSYAFVRGQGNDGPYSIDWDLDGVHKIDTVVSVEALKDSMNVWDSMGNWSNSTSSFTLSGGDYKNVAYGDLNITHIATNIPTNILVNTTTVAFGSEITVSPEPGLHQVIAMEKTTCCSDTLYILVEPDCNLVADITIVNSGCCDNDGGATISMTGAQEPISYDWGVLTATGNEITDLAAGTYPVTITDAYGCELIKEVVITQDCDLLACSDLITPDSVEVNVGEPIDFCLKIKPQDYNIYNILLDGDAYTPPTNPCNLDTVLFYTYALVVGQGATGPYQVDWTIDGQLHEGMAGTMDELATLMNTWDANGNWENNAASFIISGGQDGVNYGDMHVKHIASSVTATIMRNVTSVAFGTNIKTTLTDVGVHELIVQNPTTCCEDKVIITVLQGCTLDVTLASTPTECCPSGSVTATVTGGVEPYSYEWNDAISTTNEATGLGGGTYFVTVSDSDGCSVVKSVVVGDNCDRSACPDIVSEENINAEVGETVELCLDIVLDQMDLYDIILDGSNYQPPLNPCSMDTVVFYTYALALNQGKNGPYDVNWVSHGTNYNAQVQNMDSLVVKMNEWDPSGNWVNNDTTLTISGGDSSNKYGGMDITHIETQVVANILTNFTGVGNGSRIDVEMISGGEHTLIVKNKTTCCADTVHISVPLTPLLDTMYVTTPYNMNADTCMDMSQLAGSFASITSCNDPVNGVVEMGTDNCITYDPNEDYVGQDTFCVVVCDDLSVCDTTYVIMTVEPKVTCPDLIENEFISLAADDCEGTTSICLDLSMDDAVNYTIYDNGDLYTAGLTDCTIDTSFRYAYDEINGLSTSDLPGIYGFTIESWEINGTTVSSDTRFYSRSQMLNEMRALDPTGRWKIKAESFTIESGSTSNVYGKMKVVNVDTDAPFELSAQARYAGNGIDLKLEVGIHEIVVVDDLLGCSDTVTIAVSCIKPNIVMDSVYVGETKKMCLTSDDLVTTVTSTTNACEEISGERVVFTLDADKCINYEGMEVGQESACIVFCDDYGLCDTTYVIVSVLEKIKKVNPVTVDDQEITLKNTPVVIDVLVNDTIPDALESLSIAQNPEHGTVVVNSDNTITYSPANDYCDDSSADYFTYVACTNVGCDTSTVFVTVPCEKLHVFTGISPDGDNTNDQFVIKGIENYPEARVCVFNRWGNLVMEETGYKNDWEGTWNNETLPSGTYFYVIYMKDGDILSGYLQLMNR